MRISEGKINYSLGSSVYANANFEITYPDEVVFAYNPLYMKIKLTNVSCAGVSLDKLKVQFFNGTTSRTITVSLINGEARIYYSRILELFFDEVKRERVKYVDVQFSCSWGTRIANFSHTVIWGSLAIGERFDEYGVFKYDREKPYLERNRIWFVNFPFTISLFQAKKSGQGASLKAKYDEHPYDDNLSLYSPMFTMMLDKLSDIVYTGNPDSDACPSNKSIQAIIYADDKKKFYGLYDENHICATWNAKAPFYYDDTYYNSGARPRTDMKWGFGDNTFYRYDRQTDRLIPIEYGFYGDYGLFELDPSFTFPNAQTEATYRQIATSGTTKTSVFDETFDFTFFNSSEFTTITNLIINRNTAGYYLRWIDRFGCFQYFLFTKGEADLKNKLSGNTFVEMTDNNGMWFPNHVRDIQISATDTRKCQANSLTDDIYAYVSTVVTSPVIDLYMGKNKSGQEIWVPVNIVASSHKHNPRKVLHNLEISFTMPDIQAQSL